MPQYEIVGIRSLSAEEIFKPGDVIPGGPGKWIVHRIEQTGYTMWTDSTSKTTHTRLICHVLSDDEYQRAKDAAES